MSKKPFFYFLCAVALAALLLTSCEKETETETVIVYTPTVTVPTAPVAVSSAGGSFSFAYTVSNPADDGRVACSVSESWISDVTDTGTGVSFIVSANPSCSVRSGQITLNYSSAYGSISRTVTVAQYGIATPALTVQPTATTADTEGGDYSFNYTIVNPTDDGTLGCSADVSWIDSFDYSADGAVGFTVDRNDGGTMREGVINVTYTYGDGELTQTVTVIQNHPGGRWSIDDIVGTYTATGYTYDGVGVCSEKSWTMKIYRNRSTGGVIIDGLVPESQGLYPNSMAYVAQGGLNSDGQLVIPTQLTGYTNWSFATYYIGWTPCVDYDPDVGWYYDYSGPDCTFTYDPFTDTWVSDYGEFLCQFSLDDDWSSFAGFADVTNPGVVITKTSSGTSSVTLTESVVHPVDENLIFHTEGVSCMQEPAKLANDN